MIYNFFIIVNLILVNFAQQNAWQVRIPLPFINSNYEPNRICLLCVHDLPPRDTELLNLFKVLAFSSEERQWGKSARLSEAWFQLDFIQMLDKDIFVFEWNTGKLNFSQGWDWKVFMIKREKHEDTKEICSKKWYKHDVDVLSHPGLLNSEMGDI